jgi:hypothetical protein
MPDILVTPPIRTPLTSSNGDSTTAATPDSGGVTRTTRDWWLYWNRLGAQANSNAKLVTQGTHADRPTATDSPDGALYVESDRGAIYQNQNGVWRYVAGTMWGTVTPDQRPTDLGVNDGGFDFRGTDDAREFIWSQTQWIEVTEVRYGTHAGRPNPVDVANGALYVEFDRGGVIYQNQDNVWKYLAGTMWGTLSPDQRPTDLGVNDAGFDFRATDQQREFIWSQTVWVEVSPVPQTPWLSDIDGANHSLGNVAHAGIGTPANPAVPLEVRGSGGAGSIEAARLSVDAGSAGDGPALSFRDTGTQLAGQIASWKTGASTADLVFSTASAGALGLHLRLTAGGNVIQRAPGFLDVNQVVNGFMSIALVSNTQLAFYVRGTDGVMRSASLTLA